MSTPARLARYGFYCLSFTMVILIIAAVIDFETETPLSMSMGAAAAVAAILGGLLLVTSMVVWAIDRVADRSWCA